MAPEAQLPRYCREAVERVLASDTLRSSNSLRKLLEYLTDKTLAGAAEDLKEFTIGVEALERPENYDPQVDPSVRVQVSRLRRKLARYYEEESPQDPVRISLPKRQFRLVFDEIAESGDAAPAPGRPGGGFNVRLGIGIGVAVAVLAAFFLGEAYSGRGDASTLAANVPFSAPMREFWRPYLESDTPPTVALGVALFVRVPGTPVTYLRQSQINSWPPREETPGLAALSSALGDGSDPQAIYNYCGVGEAIAAFLVGRNLLAGGLDAPIVRSNAFSWDEAQSGNLIFVGPPKYNTLIRTGAFERNFRVVEGGIENLEPLNGEPNFYGKREEPTGRPGMAHALISRFPNKHGGVVTILASNDGTGTWGAAEYLTQPELIKSLVEKLRGADGEAPKAFEVVLRVRCDLDYPLDITYVTHRAY